MMPTKAFCDGSSPFKGRQPLTSTSGFVSGTDETVEMHLAELNRLLGKRIFRHVQRPEATADDVSVEAPRTKTSKRGQTDTVVAPPILEVLQLPLTPKRVSERSPWADPSLAHALNAAKEEAEFLTLSDYIDTTSELSALKYAFLSDLSSNWYRLDDNTQAVLQGHPAIGDYLIAFAFHVMDVEEINGLKNFVLNNRAGARNITNYAITSAARTIIDKYKLHVPDFNDDTNPLLAQILSAQLSLSKAAFESSLRSRIDDYIFNTKYIKLLNGANVGSIPVGLKQLLIQKIKHFPIPIDSHNVNYFLPLFINEAVGVQKAADVTPADAEESDREFDVTFLAEDTAFVPISKSALKCAAQLYYGMVVGDELDIFSTVNYFTHRFLVRGGLTIEDKRLRKDLQEYVFSNQFTNLSTGQLVDRTRPAERQMFYRQVFNYGSAQTTDDVILNTEFPRLWKVLIVESAKYLERTQASPNADFFVSRQNVMQAVEDLQYNLSSHCTGMANVITPLIYAEADFVLRRIFMHPEVVRQVVPAGGTWWRVVEALYMGMRNARPKATVLYNKAKLGHSIIRSLADYNAATFETDSVFFAFIKDVDRFITTQSILQEAVVDKLIKEDDEYEEDVERNGVPEMEGLGGQIGMPAASPSHNGDDGWDF